MAILSAAAGAASIAAESREIDYHDAVAVTTLSREGKIEEYMPEMNIEATPEQLAAWRAAYPLSRTYVAMPESRYRPLRPMYETIPAEWLKLTPETPPLWRDAAQPGEYYVFQVGVFPMRQDLQDLRAAVSDLENEAGDLIGSAEATCFNSGGIDLRGRPFTRRMNLPMGHFQPLWFGIQIPENAAGTYRGKVLLSPDNGLTAEIPLELTVSGEPLPDGGVSRDRALSKLKWLNSTIAQDGEVTRGYRPLVRDGSRIALLGREVVLGADGLPAEVNTFFRDGNQTVSDTGRPVLAEPIRFELQTGASGPAAPVWSGPEFLSETPARIAWRATGTDAGFDIAVEGALEFDGYLEYRIAVTARDAVTVEDIRWEIPYTDLMSQYMMGMNFRGGARPVSYDWSWDVNRRGQDAIWIGGVEGGISCRLLGPESHARQVNVYYQFGPLRLPEGWGNFGKGGARVRTDDGVTRFSAFSGRRKLAAGQTVHFGVQMNLTPVKPLDREALYRERFFHSGNYNPLAAEQGATVQNMHHTADGNEWINYPLRQRNVQMLKEKAASSHRDGVKYKIYYTVRETSLSAPEMSAVLGLDGEIIFPGPGRDVRTVIMPDGPTDWQIANLRRNFIPAWPSLLGEGDYAGFLDTAILPRADSRWDNLYLEGLNYLVREAAIDGIYVDDTLNGRESMRRARKILDRGREGAGIDLHTWNHFNEMAGWECCLILYLPILPYVDHLWIGEARNYDFAPDYWLVEVSGIPFGVPSQMLQAGGQPWRGMLFGMTGRGGYGARHEPAFMWRYWDEFGLADTLMTGFWDPEVPVRTDNPQLPVTVYRGNGKALLAIANWSGEAQTAELFIDCARLGLEPDRIAWRIPEIGGGFQQEAAFDPARPVTVPGGRGFLIEATAR